MDDKAEHGIVQDNGRNSNIVSAYSYNTGITLATEACREKGNEIKAIPQLIDKISISGKIVTADAMSMQKDIIDKIRKKGGDFQIELKANQRSLRYGVDSLRRILIRMVRNSDMAESRLVPIGSLTGLQSSVTRKNGEAI